METIVVPPMPTRLSREEALSAIKTAASRALGLTTEKQSAILLAQWALETGWGIKMYNFNFGGIKGSDPKTGMITYYGTSEGYGKTQRSEVDGFRAYKTAEDGAEDYINLLANRYPKAIEKVRKEDPEGFVNELKGVYFTGDPEKYLKGIRSIVYSLVGKPVASRSPVASKKPKGSKPTKRSPGAVAPGKSKKKTSYVIDLSDQFFKKATTC